MISEEKSRLRREMLDKLRDFPQAQRDWQSREIEEKFFALPELQSSEKIGFFASEEFEVNTDELIEASLRKGKRVFLPRISPAPSLQKRGELEFHEVKNLDDLELGEFGIRAPRETAPKIDLAEIDLLLVPGLAFTKDGERLGRGGGFFDRVLAKFRGDSVGLAFDFQLLPELPTEEWDEKVSKVLTAKEIE